MLERRPIGEEKKLARATEKFKSHLIAVAFYCCGNSQSKSHINFCHGPKSVYSMGKKIGNGLRVKVKKDDH
jgi:hypothetical protein